MAAGAARNEKAGSAETGVAESVVQGFVDRKKAAAEAKPVRRQHYSDALNDLQARWENYDPQAIQAGDRAYSEKEGRGFRQHFSGLTFMDGGFQYPFVEVAPGIHMTIREMTAGEERRGPRDGGAITEYKVVVQVPGAEGPTERDRFSGDIAGEEVYATIPLISADSTIAYTDPGINDSPLLAEQADRELLAQLGVLHAGHLELLGNPPLLPAVETPAS